MSSKFESTILLPLPLNYNSMSKTANLYSVIGLSSNNVIELIIIEGYNYEDIYHYILNNNNDIQHKYPFIGKTISNLIDIYKTQYKNDQNINNFKFLMENSDEFSTDSIKIIEFLPKETINACSYYKNTKKVICLKNKDPIIPQTISLDNLNQTTDTQSTNRVGKPPPKEIKTKISIKKKVQ